MIQFRLAKADIKHNWQQVGLFILASSLMIAINYIFLNLLANDDVSKSNYGQVIVELLKMGKNFTLIVAVFFMLYANSFLLRQRDHELGLYNMLGMTKNNLRQLLLLEKVFLYIVSLVVGLILGSTFIKLAFIILQNLLNNKQLQEQFSVTQLGQSAIIFGVVFIALYIFDCWRLRKLKPAALWQQAVQAEKEPQAKRLLGIGGLLVLGCGYWIAVKTKPNMVGIPHFMLAVILVVIGTYAVFMAGSILLLQYLKQKRSFYYQPRNFIGISGMLYRMKQNAAGLATICILCTTILVTLTASISLVVGQQRLISFWNPYDLMITTKQPLDTATVDQLAQKNQVTLKQQQQLKITSPLYGVFNKNGHFKKGMTADASISLSVLTLKDFNRIQHQKIKLKPNQVLVDSATGQRFAKLNIKNKNYQVKGYVNLKAGNLYHSIFQPVFLVTADAKAAQQIGTSQWLYQSGINLSGSAKHRRQVATQLQQQLKLDNGSFSYRNEMQQLLQGVFGSLLFVGILISFALAIATALIIYYKQSAEGLADQQRFKTMQQVGLSKAESRQAIYSQVLLVFMLPIIGAVINTGFALPALRSVLKIFSLYDGELLLQVCAMTAAALLIGYLLIYGLTTKVYQQLVNRGN
ncbi:MAG: ABC transporter permease [Liquorilactobacillus ghanensis]|uniref:ABC transporter permease n=1 Tax=Liquorilactobacillus ghanensis TaxID=399370 RepID=UPI0039E92DB3